MSRRATLRAIFWLLALWAEVAGGEPSIERDCCEWQLSAPFYVSAATWFLDDGRSSHSLTSLALVAELTVARELSPWSTGVFVGRVYSHDAAVDGTLNTGVSLEHAARRWDSALWIFSHSPPSASSQWVFATRVRYLLAPQHKVGLEVLGSFESGREPDVMLGYYGKITDSLTLKIAAGANLNAGNERIARTELVWQIH